MQTKAGREKRGHRLVLEHGERAGKPENESELLITGFVSVSCGCSLPGQLDDHVFLVALGCDRSLRPSPLSQQSQASRSDSRCYAPMV